MALFADMGEPPLLRPTGSGYYVGEEPTRAGVARVTITPQRATRPTTPTDPMEADVASSTPSKAELRARLVPLISQGLEAARGAPREEAWLHLERAHILSQPFPGLHVKVHVRMLGRAFRDRRWRELFGQIPRLLFAGPGSLFGRYPRGNRGTTAISMFRPEPMASDLARLLSEDPEDATR